MNEWQLALAIIVPALAVIGIVVTLYYIVFPRLLVKKFRGGADGVSFPENFESMQNAVIVERDKTFESAFENASYDIYRPKEGSRAAVVWLHGGFFVAGDKRGTENVCTFLASKGITVLSMNYALAPERKHPSALLQLDELLAHIKNDKTTDFAKIVLAGDSAGGNIVSEYVSLLSNESLRAKSGIALSADIASIAAVVLVCAPIELGRIVGHDKRLDLLLPTFGRAYFGTGKWYKKSKFDYLKTIDNVTEKHPPTFLTDGNHMSFESQNKKLAQALQSKGVEVAELFFEDGTVEHEYLFKMSDERAMYAAEKICEFIADKFNEKEAQ